MLSDVISRKKEKGGRYTPPKEKSAPLPRAFGTIGTRVKNVYGTRIKGDVVRVEGNHLDLSIENVSGDLIGGDVVHLADQSPPEPEMAHGDDEGT
jgi:hypothetical protein